MEDVYEHMIHPQKRILVKDMLDFVIVRVLELRRELVQFNINTPFLKRYHAFNSIVEVSFIGESVSG